MTTITELDTRFPLVGTDGIEIDDGNPASDTERVDISQIALVSFDAVGDANALGKAGHLARYEGGITTDRTFTLPDADVTVGDRCAVSNETLIPRATGEVIIADGAGHVLGFTAASGSPNEVTRLFIAGESMVFIAMVGSPNPIWMPIDGRIQSFARMIMNTNITDFFTSSTWLIIPFDLITDDRGDLAVSGSSARVHPRRGGRYQVGGHVGMEGPSDGDSMKFAVWNETVLADAWPFQFAHGGFGYAPIFGNTSTVRLTQAQIPVRFYEVRAGYDSGGGPFDLYGVPAGGELTVFNFEELF